MLHSPRQQKELLLELAEGNESAFEEIYKLYSPRLFGRLLKLVKSSSIAEEILQDVFLKLWEHRKSIDSEKSFRSFLFKIAENKVYDFFRSAARNKKRAAQLILLSTTRYTVIEEFTLFDEKSDAFQRAIDSLPVQRRQVFRLCKLDGKSYKEVSELLGISLSTISDHIVKGTKTIREYLNSHHKELLGVVTAFCILQ
ncbi:MAG: RNA polymerase sigma factor [Chitinophagales bacterium]